MACVKSFQSIKSESSQEVAWAKAILYPLQGGTGGEREREIENELKLFFL